MPLVTLETLSDPMAAEFMRMRLEAGGIDAVLFDSGIGSLIGNVLGVRVMVLDEDEAAARALLADNGAAI